MLNADFYAEIPVVQWHNYDRHNPVFRADLTDLPAHRIVWGYVDTGDRRDLVCVITNKHGDQTYRWVTGETPYNPVLLIQQTFLPVLWGEMQE